MAVVRDLGLADALRPSPPRSAGSTSRPPERRSSAGTGPASPRASAPRPRAVLARHSARPARRRFARRTARPGTRPRDRTYAARPRGRNAGNLVSLTRYLSARRAASCPRERTPSFAYARERCPSTVCTVTNRACLRSPCSIARPRPARRRVAPSSSARRVGTGRRAPTRASSERPSRPAVSIRARRTPPRPARASAGRAPLL